MQAAAADKSVCVVRLCARCLIVKSQCVQCRVQSAECCLRCGAMGGLLWVTSISQGGVGELCKWLQRVQWLAVAGPARFGPPVFPLLQGLLTLVDACARLARLARLSKSIQALQINQKFPTTKLITVPDVSQLGLVPALCGSCNRKPLQPLATSGLTRSCTAGFFPSCGPLRNSDSAAEGWIGLRWESCACCTCILTSFWAGEKIASALLLPLIVLSRLYRCIDNAVDGGPRHWACRCGRVSRRRGCHLDLHHDRVSDEGFILFIIVSLTSFFDPVSPKLSGEL